MTRDRTMDHRRVLFIGAVHEAEPALKALMNSMAEVVQVITLPGVPGTRPFGYVDLEPIARSRGIPVHRCKDVNSEDEVHRIKALGPDLLVVVGWTRLLGSALLEIPRRGCIGFHASLLPRNKGRAPVNWSILRGEKETGNTMMYLNVGTDTGDVVDQRRVIIGPDDTCATVYERIGETGAEMLRDHIDALLDGTAPRRPQEPDRGELLSKRTPSMGITDWARSSGAVHDWIRALTRPYPGAFGFWTGQKVMFWASKSPRTHPTDLAGTVIDVDDDGIRVATLDGSLLVTSISTAGCPPQDASMWAQENGLRAGDGFDPVDRATSLWARGLGPAPTTVSL